MTTGRRSVAGNQRRTYQLRNPHLRPRQVIENLEELDDDNAEIYESIEDIWPDYPTKEDFMWNEEEY